MFRAFRENRKTENQWIFEGAVKGKMQVNENDFWLLRNVWSEIASEQKSMSLSYTCFI